MTKVAVIPTGGTYLSLKTERGLRPPDISNKDELGIAMSKLEEVIEKGLQYLRLDDKVDVEVIEPPFMIDSTDLTKDNMFELLSRVKSELSNKDSVIILHGTDTLAFEASFLSFFLDHEIHKSKNVVITGAMAPLLDPVEGVYAEKNLLSSLLVAQSGLKGVYVVFHDKVILGTRAVKYKALDVDLNGEIRNHHDAFTSSNVKEIARVSLETKNVIVDESVKRRYMDCLVSTKGYDMELEDRIVRITIFPGMREEVLKLLILSKVGEFNVRGVIIDSFGTGGIPKHLVKALDAIAKSGIPVLVTTQVLDPIVLLEKYAVGMRLREIKGEIFSSLDMTRETASIKVMWALAQKSEERRGEIMMKAFRFESILACNNQRIYSQHP